MTANDWIELEESTQLKTYRKWPLPLVKASGAWVEDVDGNRYLDLYGGHCVAFLGHNHPKVVAAIKDQADSIMFYSNALHCHDVCSTRRLPSDFHGRLVGLCTGVDKKDPIHSIRRQVGQQLRSPGPDRSIDGV